MARLTTAQTNSAIDSSRAAIRPLPEWQRALQRAFANIWVELAIGAMILISVVLTILQIALEGPHGTITHEPLETINHAITWMFAVELSLRWLSYRRKRQFFREYWVDILSLLPLLRVFRVFRALRLLRLLRLLRIIGVVRRLSSYFPEVIRRGATEYLVIGMLLLLTILFGTGAIFSLETARGNEHFASWYDAFWFSVYSLFAGEPIPQSPHSLGGRFVATGIMFMGLTIFAMFTGTVSAFMVDRLRREDRTVDFDELSGHVIICGWSRKGDIILRELQHALASQTNGWQAFVVITEFDPDKRPAITPELAKNVHFLNEDFTRVAALEKAGIHRAKTCILLSDTSGNRSEQDADARTILAALTVEKLNSKVYTCAEINNRAYGSHLEMGHVNDYVVGGEQSAYLLAQAALNRGLMAVVTDLLTQEYGNQFYRIPIRAEWTGRTFWDLFHQLKQAHDSILVAVCLADGTYRINPKEYTIQVGDELILIAERAPVI